MSETHSDDPRLELGPGVQVGIVVRDAEAAAAAWTSRFRIGPVQIIDWPVAGTDMAQTGTYRGRHGNFRMRLAFLQAGPVQIEFIQPLEGENIYSEFLAEHGEGLHHILFEVDDPHDFADKLGAPIIQSGGSTLRPGAIWAYLETQAMLGALIEVKTKAKM